MIIGEKKIQSLRDKVFAAVMKSERPVFEAVIWTAASRMFRGNQTLGGIIERLDFFNVHERMVFANSVYRARTISELVARAHLRARLFGIRFVTPTEAAKKLQPDPAFKVKARQALSYFKQLSPGSDLPLDWEKAHRRTAFTMAKITEETTLKQVHGKIFEAMDAGVFNAREFKDWMEKTLAKSFKKGLIETLGVSAKNPQYAEMVYRTNAMDAYNDGYRNEVMENADMQEYFPWWEYLAVKDARLREDHAENLGGGPKGNAYYPQARAFADVRGTNPFNCRCSFRWLDKYEAEELKLVPKEKKVPPVKPPPTEKIFRPQTEDWAKDRFKGFGEKLIPMERSSFDYYVGEGHARINAALRTGEGLTGVIKDAAGHLDNAFKKVGKRINRDIISFRGIKDPAVFGELRNLKGKIVGDKAFVSTSFRKETALEFAGKKGILVEVKIPEGSKGIWTDSITGEISDERELLLSRKNRFRVLDVIKTKGEPALVRMELLP